MIKFFLHLSKEEQRRRLLKRLDDPAKQWKFSMSPISRDRPLPSTPYQDAYEADHHGDVTPWAPLVRGAGRPQAAMRALVGGIIVDVIDGRRPPHPAVWTLKNGPC